MKPIGHPGHVDVYLRRRGANEGYMLLVSETSSADQKLQSLALEVVRRMRVEVPDYEFLLLIVGCGRHPFEE